MTRQICADIRDIRQLDSNVNVNDSQK